MAPSLERALNATGIIVHTNLGRAPLSPRAIAAVTEVATGYCNLELDLQSGKRGSRHRHAEHLLSFLFPGKKATIVNNAAAAVMLSLNTFALGKEVVISRGELVEIGGAFRVPEILERSGARLKEVGTTNKTRLEETIGKRSVPTPARFSGCTPPTSASWGSPNRPEPTSSSDWEWNGSFPSSRISEAEISCRSAPTASPANRQ